MPISIDYTMLPPRLQGGMQRYIEDGIRPGDFLFAVLSNDLRGAVARADHGMLPQLGLITSWVVNEVPVELWGCASSVLSHIAWKSTERRAIAERKP